ncbi:hypothetical protein [Desulfomonile tiedjei]|uniref:Outer membrane protein beta-barrel domain-containing protein n=1 Tax=Desulfomonile tiedjei (strain ATCC 49306 / DSM 6799 / DCB-1) TaxID=706587 RepID=I4CDJ5_DESTA|nr:hypothetical protein [Desulfomonile tiedjei]AFM27636.1 hypothetical protein Desti_5025 [Desulfomonile tiedjei DSM 6799]
MKRVAVLFIALSLIMGLSAINAEAFLGAGLPAPFTGFFGSGAPSSCGPVCDPPALAAGTAFYVGWMEDHNGARINVTADNPANVLLGVTEINHRYPLKGLWLGLTQTVPFSEYCSLVASGWYLIPSNERAQEEYRLGTTAADTNWGTKTQWWFVDGLLAFGSGNGQLLAGVRYDEFTTKFDDRSLGFFLPTDTANVTTYNVIPLVGLQYVSSNLVFRIVGIPTLVGTLKYRENVAGTSLEATSNWRGGYFLEFFGEYGWKVGGMADFGVFGRYNLAQGKSQLDLTTNPGGLEADYNVSVHRSSWTLGGKMSLNFAIPYM